MDASRPNMAYLLRVVLLTLLWQTAVASNAFGSKHFEEVLQGSWPRAGFDASVRSLCGGACMNTSLVYEQTYLVPITQALQKAQRTKKLVVAIVGDSVGAGGVAPKGHGFFDGFGAYLKQMPALRDEVKLKNLSRGGQGPYSLFMCSGLEGDEDIVI
eukprot:scaffold3416_cov185-Amphora_coffeaeformis.AAC.6